MQDLAEKKKKVRESYSGFKRNGPAIFQDGECAPGISISDPGPLSRSDSLLQVTASKTSTAGQVQRLALPHIIINNCCISYTFIVFRALRVRFANINTPPIELRLPYIRCRLFHRQINQKVYVEHHSGCQR
jgi:hypothetical protein